MPKYPDDGNRAPFDLVEKNAGDDFDRELLSWALHKVMNAEVCELTRAGKGEHAPERETARNGYRPRDRETRIGTIPPTSPSCARRAAFPAFSNRAGSRRGPSRRPSGRPASTGSPRSEDRPVRAMGASGVSKSRAGRL